jgi:hypothetical protein
MLRGSGVGFVLTTQRLRTIPPSKDLTTDCGGSAIPGLAPAFTHHRNLDGIRRQRRWRGWKQAMQRSASRNRELFDLNQMPT